MSDTTPAEPTPRRLTTRTVAASLAILLVLAGFGGATWFGVSQVLSAPINTDVQRGIDDISAYAEGLSGVAGVTGTEVARGPAASPARDGYLTVETEPGIGQDARQDVAELLERWLVARATVSQVRLHVALASERSTVGLAASPELNADRFALADRGADDTQLASISVLWQRTDGADNLDEDNNALVVELVPNAGVDVDALRARWAPLLDAVAPSGTLAIR